MQHESPSVNVSENHESIDESICENLDSCTERSFLSQKQCRLIYQQLRNIDVCLEENFSDLMHGNIFYVFLKSLQRVTFPEPNRETNTPTHTNTHTPSSENFFALMRGIDSDGVHEVCAARDSP